MENKEDKLNEFSNLKLYFITYLFNYFMAHLLGIYMKNSQNLVSGLTNIYGIGRTSAKDICMECGINPQTRIKDLTENEFTILSKEIEIHYMVESDLVKKKSQHLKRLLSIKCYRGLRHYSGLPVRGQRTRSNSKTQKRIGKRIRKTY